MPHLTRHIAVLVLLTAVLLTLQAGSATAGAVLTVDSTSDAVDVTPGDTVCASATNGCTVRAAIQEANAMAGFQSIVIPAGTYAISIPGSGEDDGATGDFDVSDDVSISGFDIDDTIIDGASLDRVFDVTGGTVEIKDLTIQHGLENTVWGGGAIRNFGDLTLLRTNVTLNWAVVCCGAVNNRSTMTIAQSTIDSNHSEDSAGGVATLGQMQIIDSTISNNVAETFTGGVESGESLSIINSTISGNTGEIVSGGLHTTVGGSTEVTNSTIVNNEGGDNGGVRVTGGSTVTLTNTIVANNSGENCLTGSGTTLTSLGHNIGSDATCGLNAAGDLPSTDPLIGPLQSNGGFTNTHALLQGSPAIDAGDAALCPNHDQRGTARPQGPVCDIGAYEATGTEPPPANLQAPWGDNNCSQQAPDPVDSLLTLRFDAGLSANTGDCPPMGTQIDVQNASLHLWGDVDCSGEVNPVDSLKLLRFDAGLSVPQEANCPLVGSNVIITLT